MSGPHGLRIHNFDEPIGWPIEFGNYSPAVRAEYEGIRDQLAAPTPAGRLVIADGPPGVGKTFLLRGLVHDLAAQARFIYLPASLVPRLDGPEMLSLLEEDDPGKPRIMIIEDADECLLARAADNMSSIRTLLNVCDGFLGAMLDIRVVATTNSGHISRTGRMDDALLRPGRLLSRMTVGSLDAEHAAKRITELSGKDASVSGPMALASVYATARELGWRPL